MTLPGPDSAPEDVLRIAVTGWQDEPQVAAWLGEARRRRIPGPELEAVHWAAAGIQGHATWEVSRAAATRGGPQLWGELEVLHGGGHEIRLVEEPAPHALRLWALAGDALQLPAGLPGDLVGALRELADAHCTLWRVKDRMPARSAAEAAGSPQPPMPDTPMGERAAATDRNLGTPVTLIVPLFREAENAVFLLRSLDEVVATLAPEWAVQPLLVDDGSDDGTWDALRSAVNARPAGAVQIAMVRHEANRGIAAAIRTGLQHAKTEFCASMDADGSYDPNHLAALLPHLKEGADLVTGSPYHPQGAVRHVPGWRLLLSKGLSRMYRLTCGIPIHTFTSCFRAYRREAVADLPLQDPRYLGIAELLIRLHSRGGAIWEVPATLETRLYGVSKLKTGRAILGHLLLWLRATLRLVR